MQLPPAPAGFAGRQVQLRRLAALFAARGSPQRAPIVITGTAGVGKTALAVHWAHRVGHRFPDGLLYIDLRGWSDALPVAPLRALAILLQELGVSGEQIPTELGPASARWRSLLAARRVLLTLDNVATADQIRPLLPGRGPSAVVITSRDRLAGLVASHGAVEVDLGPLSGHESMAVLAAIMGRRRVEASRCEAARLVDLCGRLPLALRIAAAHLSLHPNEQISDYVRALADGDRLGTLSIDGDEASGVGAAFDLSYNRLDTEQQRLFRLLALAPGADVTTEAAAALAALETTESERLLTRLATVHLLESRGAARYGLHDLVRAYAGRRCRQDDSPQTRADATAGLYGWYVSAATTAALRLAPHVPLLAADPATEARSGLTQPTDAVRWLHEEHHNLVAAIQHAAAAGQTPAAVLIADALRGFLAMRSHAVELVGIGWALRPAEPDEPARTAVAELALGAADYIQGRLHQARSHHSAALDGARAAGWIGGVSNALSSLGTVNWELGDLAAAAAQFRQALAIERRAGHEAGQARLDARLGFLAADQGLFRQAIRRFRRALAIDRRLGFDLGSAIDHNSLGFALHGLGNLDEAAMHLDEALRIVRAAGNRGAEASILDNLAAVHRDRGELDTARSCAVNALALATEIHHDRFQADAHNTLGSILNAQADHDGASEHHRQALELAGGVGNLTAQVQARLGLAAADLALGATSQAIVHATEARHVASERGYQVLLGRALLALATAALLAGDHQSAAKTADQAREIHAQHGHRLHHARALQILAAARDRGEPGAL